MALRSALLFALLLVAGPATGQTTPEPDPIDLLVTRLQQAAEQGDVAAIEALAADGSDRSGLEDFAGAMAVRTARVVVKERDRTPLDDGGQRLLIEVFVERGIEGRVGSWRMDVRPGPAGDAPGAPVAWRISRMERLAVVSGLYKLSLNATREFDVHDLAVRGPDLTLTMASGKAFVAETPDGPTAVVLVGRGRMHFTPPDPAERTQVRIFSGDEALNAEFDGALIRVRPTEFDRLFPAAALTARDVTPRDLRRGQDIFDEYIGKSLQIDLTDLSRERWSLAPSAGDLIVEVSTRKYGNLTYARAGSDAEDISLFDRKRRKNIAVYASAEKLASRGRFYSEDDLVDYDILDYDIDATFVPDRMWTTGNARMTVRVRAEVLSTMTLRLADSLVVRGVYSPSFGRLLHLRVVGQNSIIVNLPGVATRGTELALMVIYSGRLEPQLLDREAVTADPDGMQDQEPLVIPLEPRYIYSNRSYWYPQSTVTDYATAKLRITVPPDYDVVASGSPAGPPAPAPGPVASGERPLKTFVFNSDRPARYLACVISRFNTVTTAELNVPAAVTGTVPVDPHVKPVSTGRPGSKRAAAAPDAISLVVQANPRQAGRARSLGDRSADIIKYYASLVGEAPYPSFTLAITESDLPGGHSPAYFAVLNQQLPTSTLTWRNDPVSFDGYPTFFLAHELAHQWWGQAIGWKNYHEQWLSEGFAQYFAVLYAERERGPGILDDLMRQMRRWSIEASPQGPIYLGYRLGHIKSDGRVFRAVVYNKAAMVLHMLRRLVGDDAFFGGIRTFYATWRFQKAGTNDFREAMEAASGRDLQAFFDAWVYGSAVPRLRFSHETIGPDLKIRFEHRGEVMPLAVTVSVIYQSGETEKVTVPITERTAERTIPLKGGIRAVEVNQDNAAIAEFDK